MAEEDTHSQAPAGGSDLVERLSRGRVLVVGDLMLDRHVWGNVERVSPEAPIQVLAVRREESTPGGAANVACKVAELGGRAVLAGLVGHDREGEEIIEAASELRVDCSGVVQDPERPTTVKTRHIARGQQLLRVDREGTERVAGETELELAEAVASALPGCDAVVIEDYGKGALSPGVLDSALARAGEVPVVVDPHGTDWSRYRGVTVITPNVHELGAAARCDIEAREDIVRAARAMIERSGAHAIAVTRGPDGITVVTSETVDDVPTVAVEVFDVTGAGDAVAATFALALAAGFTLREAAEAANLAGGAIVRQIGVGRISRELLERAAAGRAGSAERKVVSLEEAVRESHKVASGGGRAVFTNGCFDLVHRGHVALLEEARRRGELLIVGLNSDESARRLKGPSRPVLGEAERAYVLASLAPVDLVVIFDEDTPERLIREIDPRVLVKGADYAESEIVGADIVKSRGGEVVRVPLVEGASTSSIVERVRNAPSGEPGSPSP